MATLDVCQIIKTKNGEQKDSSFGLMNRILLSDGLIGNSSSIGTATAGFLSHIDSVDSVAWHGYGGTQPCGDILQAGIGRN